MTEVSPNDAAVAMAAAIAAAAQIAMNETSNLGMLATERNNKKLNQALRNTVSSTVTPPNEHEHETEAEASAHNSNSNSDDSDDEEEDAEKRLARSRERNREHARRTRLRKKAQLEALQDRAKGLEEEAEILKESVEECSVASILVDISSGATATADSVTNTLLNADLSPVKPKISLCGGKRKRFIHSNNEDVEMTPQPLKLSIDGQVTFIGGGGTHINWKTGVYSGENGEQRKLSQEQLECLRRERNRMHAKMTRDRKKNFISSIEKTIEQLETRNQKMRHALLEVAKRHPCVTPISSPLVIPQEQNPSIPHGFSLTAP